MATTPRAPRVPPAPKPDHDYSVTPKDAHPVQKPGKTVTLAFVALPGMKLAHLSFGADSTTTKEGNGKGVLTVRFFGEDGKAIAAKGSGGKDKSPTETPAPFPMHTTQQYSFDVEIEPGKRYTVAVDTTAPTAYFAGLVQKPAAPVKRPTGR